MQFFFANLHNINSDNTYTDDSDKDSIDSNDDLNKKEIENNNQ